MRASMALVRCVLRDQPGALGEVATTLGRLGIDIRSIGVSDEGDGRVVDELLVAIPDALAVEDVRRHLLEAGAADTEIRPQGPAPSPQDAAALGLRLAASLVRSGVVEEALAHTVRVLTSAHDAWVVPVPEDPPTELLAEAARSRIPVSELGGSVRGRTGGEGSPWVLSVPSERTSATPRLAVALRAGSAFTAGEIDRVTALLQLVESVESGQAPHRAGPPVPASAASHAEKAPGWADLEPWDLVLGGGERATVRPVRGDDALGILRMHARCSDLTLRRRFFAALPSMPMRKLRWFTGADLGTHLGLVAVVGSEIVGIAQLVSSADGDAELGMLVEDAFQQRGLGRGLLARLMSVATASGHRTLVADLLPDNDAMLGLLQTAGAPVALQRESGALRVTLELTAETTRERPPRPWRRSG